jgi:uncharacterized membrane protein YhaH (DUF805 family)
MRRIWRDYSLSIVLAVLFLVSWIGQAIVQWGVFVNEQQAHGEPLQLVQYAYEFWHSTLENWQSEFLQLLSFVVLSAVFIHKGSAESKDSDERMQASLDRIEQRLGALEERAAAGR